MADFRVSVDLSGLLQISPIVRAGIFQNLAAAVERVTMAGAERWREAVLKAPLWEGERQAYAASIRWQMTGDLSGEIVSDYKFVEDIETGRPPYDMKRMLDTSMKIRVSKRGRRYLIIPIRHNTPGNDALAKAMPESVYAAARELRTSRITGEGFRESGTGAYDIKTKQPFLVRQRQYQWGGRLPAGLAPKLRTEHKTDPYAGMVKFKDSLGPGERSAGYLTFRTMVEGSPGWIKPAKPGLFIAKKIAEGLQADAETIFGEAMRMDLAGAALAP